MGEANMRKNQQQYEIRSSSLDLTNTVLEKILPLPPANTASITFKAGIFS